MSVVGIDFGNESCFVAVARQGGIETVDNDYSLRGTPSCVAFNDTQRILGVAAKNQLVTNIKNTVFDFKRFIGRKSDDPLCKELGKGKPYKVVPTQSGLAGVEVNYLGRNQVFSFEQISAMLFTKLKQTTEHAIGTKVSDCVVSVPSFFTNAEREALLDVCSMAGLNVLRLMNDTAASALTYVFYKQDLPAIEETPRHVAFVDCGHSALQVFIVAFNKGKMRVVATASDPHIGGRDFDAIIAKHFVEEFKKKYNIDAGTNNRAYIRLLAEVDKLKKQMSANSTKLPLHIECFMNDVDVSSSLCRADFEAMAEPLLRRVESTLVQCLTQSALCTDDIHSVEIIGGTSRIPSIKLLIENVFKKVPSTTLNQDEAVARGCAIQCAILSPTFKVRDVIIEDAQPYPIKVIFDESLRSNGELPMYPKFHAMPFSKMITFYRREEFSLRAVYESDVPYTTREIGTYKVKGVKPSIDNENLKVKVKTKLDINGIFRIPYAIGYEKLPETAEPEDEPMEIETTNGNDNPTEAPVPPAETPVPPTDSSDVKMEEDSQKNSEDVPMANDSNSETVNGVNEVPANTEVPEEKKAPKPKKQQFKTIDLPVEVLSTRLQRDQLNLLIEAEAEMVAQDRKEKERIDVKNALEEYVYSLRSKLDEEYKDFVTEEEKSKMISSLNDVENWLYDEGENQERSVYAKKLEELKKFGDSVQQKLDEFLKQKMEEEQARLKALEPEPVPVVSEQKPEAEKLETDEVVEIKAEN